MVTGNAHNPGSRETSIKMRAVIQRVSSSSVTDGEFGAMMQVNIENDGPVTINIDSPIKKDKFDSPKKDAVEATQG